MSTIALCGGGTAGHITPLIAVADEIRRQQPEARFLVVGTEGGREAELLPQWLTAIHSIKRLPFPRSLSVYALTFPFRWLAQVWRLRQYLRAQAVDTVVGFGGYIAAPTYLAAWLAGIALVIHEANALPGMANRLGARLTRDVAVCFPDTPLPHAKVVGMPLRTEILQVDRARGRSAAKKHFGLQGRQPVLLVTGGSTGAQSINTSIEATKRELIAAGWKVIHLMGPGYEVPADNPAGFVSIQYTDRMDLALAAADLVVSRAGAATVSELAALGLPAVFVPYHVGNGEQALNARQSVKVGGAIMVSNSEFTPQWVKSTLLPLMSDRQEIKRMAGAMATLGVRDGATQVASMVVRAASRSRKD